MKFDVPVPCFYGKTDFCEAIGIIAGLGFGAVETYDWKNLDTEKVAAALERNNVKLVSVCTSCFNMTDPAYRGQWLECLKESCEKAKALGTDKLITQVGNDTGAERAYQHESIVLALKAARPVLEYYGITVMIEPLNVLVDHRGYYLPSSYEAFDIIREADNPYAKVIYDIYHQQVSEGNIIPTIRENIGLIAHFHAAGHPGRNDLQYGENDYRVIFKAIDETGFSGYCGLEYSPLGDSGESLLEFRRIYE